MYVKIINSTKRKLSLIYREQTMADKCMYISDDDTENYPFCRLQLMVETFGNST